MPEESTGVLRCRSCGADVWMLANQMTQRIAPIEVAENAKGNVVAYLSQGEYRMAPPGDGKHVSHFATCPGARAWRRREPLFTRDSGVGG